MPTKPFCQAKQHFGSDVFSVMRPVYWEHICNTSRDVTFGKTMGGGVVINKKTAGDTLHQRATRGTSRGFVAGGVSSCFTDDTAVAWT